MRSAAFVSVFALAACARSSTPQVPSGPLDVNIAAVAASPPLATTLPAAKMCEARLIAGVIDKIATCKLDEKISSANGVLSYPCNGEGHAEARFDDQQFEGTLSHGELKLSIVTTPTWGDECEWESHQKIEGRIAGPQLSWSLEETIVRERDEGCYGACTATATITLKRPDGT